MKRTILTLFVMIFFLSFSQAQDRKDLKGPKAKNYKPWKDGSKSSPDILVSQDPADLKGPEAKNYKPWEDQVRSRNLVAVSPSDRERVTGPEAKNSKPWEKQDDDRYVVSDKKKQNKDQKQDSGKE